jgi:hypothetical protein
MNRRFPKFPAHEQAYCWHCGGDFGEGYWSASGHAKGHGEFVQGCEKCRMSTWYDLDDPVVSAIHNFLSQPIPGCDCGAETTGKWADKHTPDCAVFIEDNRS